MNGIAVSRKVEHAFFALISLAVSATVFIGFKDSYFRAGLIFAHLPSLTVHIHGALFVSWIFLLIIQITLVATGHTRWHRRVGVLGAFMAPLMVIAGTCTLVMAVRRNAVPRIPPTVFLAGDLLQLLFFSIFVVWGLHMRKEPTMHKRLMVFATISILAPAVDRWPFSFMTSIFSTVAVLTIFPLAIAAYDLLSTRKIQRATRWGLALYALMIALIFIIPALGPWQRFTAWVLAV